MTVYGAAARVPAPHGWASPTPSPLVDGGDLWLRSGNRRLICYLRLEVALLVVSALNFVAGEGEESVEP